MSTAVITPPASAPAASNRVPPQAPGSRGFPIMGDWDRGAHKVIPARTIPWEMIAPHEPQALINHCGQSLEKLASRCGLGICEAVAVLEDRRWHKMDLRDAVQRLDALVNEYLANTEASRGA